MGDIFFPRLFYFCIQYYTIHYLCLPWKEVPKGSEVHQGVADQECWYYCVQTQALSTTLLQKTSVSWDNSELFTSCFLFYNSANSTHISKILQTRFFFFSPFLFPITWTAHNLWQFSYNICNFPCIPIFCFPLHQYEIWNFQAIWNFQVTWMIFSPFLPYRHFLYFFIQLRPRCHFTASRLQLGPRSLLLPS